MLSVTDGVYRYLARYEMHLSYLGLRLALEEVCSNSPIKLIVLHEIVFITSVSVSRKALSDGIDDLDLFTSSVRYRIVVSSLSFSHTVFFSN